MKNKKLLFAILALALAVCLVLVYIFRPMTMNDIYDEPNFKGVVTEVYEKTILVAVDSTEDAYKSCDKISVSLDVQLKDSMTNFAVGDTVKVFYDGSIAESYPAQVSTVYAILLIRED